MKLDREPRPGEAACICVILLGEQIEGAHGDERRGEPRKVGGERRTEMSDRFCGHVGTVTKSVPAEPVVPARPDELPSQRIVRRGV